MQIFKPKTDRTDAKPKAEPSPHRIKLDERDYLTICFLVQTVLWLATVPFVVGLFFLYRQLVTGPNNTFVQLPDGSSFVGEPKPANYRHPQTVKQFVEDWVTTAFTLTGTLGDGEDALPDKGIPVPGVGTVPTNAVNASFGYVDSGRQAFLKNYMQEGWVPEDYFSAEPTTTTVYLDEVSEPMLIDPDRQIYSVKVVASVNQTNEDDPVGQVKYYRKELIVTSVPIPRAAPGENASILEKLAYEWRKRGLQIVRGNPLPLYTK